MRRVRPRLETTIEILVDDEDEAAIKRARASIRAGASISMRRLMKLLGGSRDQGSTAACKA